MLKPYRLLFTLALFSTVQANTILQASIVPTTATTLNIPSNNSATVQYQFTNRSPITRQFSVTPIIGMSQISTDNTQCDNPFTLALGESCLLTLHFDGSVMVGSITGGPLVCKTLLENDNSSGDNLCIQPATTNRLAITLVAAERPTLTTDIAALTLMIGDDLPQLITVTNPSHVITASHVKASLPVLWTDITQDASNCLSLPPQASCKIEFTPGLTPYAVQTIDLAGTNTASTSMTLAISAGPLFSPDRSPITVYAGTTASLTVQNISNRTMTNIQSVFTATALAGIVSESSNNCASVEAGQSCTISFTAINTPVASTAFSLTADNITPTTLMMIVASPIAIGDLFQDGIIFEMSSNGSSGKVVSAVNISNALPFGGKGTAIGVTAQSSNDGSEDTAAIVNELTHNQAIPLTDYAAGACTHYTSAGGYHDWYLPAANELLTVWTHSAFHGGPIAGFPFGQGFWTATESAASLAPWLANVFYFGGSFNGEAFSDLKDITYPVRCVRVFS